MTNIQPVKHLQTLTHLYCEYSDLNDSNLGYVPDSVVELGFSGNKLTNIEKLPSRLKILYCFDNPQLKSLPLSVLPNTMERLTSDFLVPENWRNLVYRIHFRQGLDKLQKIRRDYLIRRVQDRIFHYLYDPVISTPSGLVSRICIADTNKYN